MAQKEALIIIIDVGSTMSREANPSGFESTPLWCSLQQLLLITRHLTPTHHTQAPFVLLRNS